MCARRSKAFCIRSRCERVTAALPLPACTRDGVSARCPPARGSARMRARNRNSFGFVLGVALVLSFAIGGFGRAAAQELGLAAKKPVVAAACKLCPWGTIADVLKEALKGA